MCRVSNFVINVIITLVLSSCQATHQPTIDTTTPGYKPVSFLSNCNKLTPNYEVNRKNAYSYYKCVADTKKKYNLSESRLETELDHKRMLLAQEYSSGKLTNIEFQKLNEQIGNNYTTTRIESLQEEERQKVQQDQTVNAQRTQAFGNALMAVGNQLQQNYYQQQYLNQNQQIINKMNRPVTTNCNSIGGMTNCSTY